MTMVTPVTGMQREARSASEGQLQAEKGAIEGLYATLPFVADYQVAFPEGRIVEATLFLADDLPDDWQSQLEHIAEESHRRWRISTLFICFDETGEKRIC